MRGLTPQLESDDEAAWARACTLAHNLAAGARLHKLGVLTACARELDKLLCERRAGEEPGVFLLNCIVSGIEAAALEVQALLREG